MAMGLNATGAGGLLGGILQGLEMGKQRRTELQHKKDLLKLEQDKVKLLEKEHKLNATTKGQESLAKILEQLNKQNEVIKGGPGEMLMRGSDIKPGGFSVPMTPAQQGVGTDANKPPAQIIIANEIVKAAKARGLKLNMDEVLFKLSQGGARSLSEQAELIMMPFKTFADPKKLKQIEDMIQDLRNKEGSRSVTGGGVEQDTGKEDWRKYIK